MGEFSLSGNANIGLSAVEVPANTPKNTNPIFYTAPTTTSTTTTDSILQGRSVMQDDLSDSKSASGANGDREETVEKPPKEEGQDMSDKLSLADQVAQPKAMPPLFHPPEPTGAPSGALWSAMEDTYAPMNGSIAFQNFPNQQLFGNATQGQQGRRAITASHNFPHNMGRQSSHPLYKGYGSWANPGPGQSWSGTGGSSAAWNRGRSVPNLTPLQQMGVAGRKPSPTFNHQQVISPVKFRRSTSYPGKGPFSQPPTFEITNMDENRELLSYQVMCGTFEHCTVSL